ncbi:zinc finger protein 652-A-like [Anopheles moucheti]|uniref:zinc finger protein 652-A-like n=1 Tax=Anopheles moucheti TaxID=186751 RepID=UPI0022F0DB74|nr:zinc finger protein 652-A-like [Anopheles moucheti]
MANVLQELLNVCRFCLCDSKRDLKPILDILDCTLTTDEVARYTGIQVNTDEDCSLSAICMECISKLRKSIEFRQTCLNNQNYIEEMLMMLVASAVGTSCESAESAEYMESADEENDLLVYQIQEEDSDIEFNANSNSTPSPDVCNMDNDMYCANYIEPATSYHSDSDDIWAMPTEEPKKKPRKKYTYKKDAPPKPIVKEHKRKRKMYEFSALSESPLYYVKTYKDGKRLCMKTLCDICGKLVTTFSSHMETHFAEMTHSCPHCPVKMKKKNNMSQHIKTVHYKIVGKTCNICGKGFVHHKTYRYHMLSHQSEANLHQFECKPCGKIFSKPFGLRDHQNRVHNIARNLKQTA